MLSPREVEKMTREELKEIINRVIDRIQDEREGPKPACLFGDEGEPCDYTTEYAVGEEG